MRAPRGPALGRWWWAVLAGALAVASAGCSVARPTINNGAVSACFRALPTASQAVHEPKASLRGVRRVPADQIEQRFPGTAAAMDNDTEVCAFAFEGSFRPGQVSGAPAAEQGRFAVVLVSSHHLKLLVSYVGAQLPGRFTQRVA